MRIALYLEVVILVVVVMFAILLYGEGVATYMAYGVWPQYDQTSPSLVLPGINSYWGWYYNGIIFIAALLSFFLFWGVLLAKLLGSKIYDLPVKGKVVTMSVVLIYALLLIDPVGILEWYLD